MRYLTAEEFYSYLNKTTTAQLTDSRGSEPDLVVLESVNSDAADEVDGYLRGVYELPLPEPAPAVIREVVADLMKFKLFKRRDSQNIADEVIKLHKITIDRLSEIRLRRFTLEAPAVDGSKSVSGGIIKSWAPAQRFGTHFTNLLGED